jgi:hypothetical protein
MYASRLRYKIDIYYKVIQSSAYGSGDISYHLTGSTKADILFRSGDYKTTDGEFFHSQIVDCFIRFRHINDDAVIKYGSNFYKILYINPFDNLRSLKLSLERIENNIIII